jgi:hypothetical protein
MLIVSLDEGKSSNFMQIFRQTTSGAKFLNVLRGSESIPGIRRNQVKKEVGQGPGNITF